MTVLMILKSEKMLKKQNKTKQNKAKNNIK